MATTSFDGTVLPQAAVTRVYGAYGHRSTPTDDARAGYAGQINEPGLGGYLLGERFYMPWLHRFANPDPISPFGAGGVNRYAYCIGDPVNSIDPSGNAPISWVGFLKKEADRIVGARTAQQALTPTIATTMAVGDAGPISMASGGAGGLAKRAVAAKSGSSAWGVIDPDRAGDPVARPGTSVHTFGKGRLSITAHAGKGKDGASAVFRHLPDSRRGHQVGFPAVPRVKHSWRQISNKAGGTNYVTDARLNRDEVTALFGSGLMNGAGHLPVVMLSGAHGNPHGVNWSKGRRLKPSNELYLEDKNLVSERMALAGRPNDALQVVNIGTMTPDQFIAQTQRAAHIVHTACFGAADRKLIKAYVTQLQPMTTYNFVPGWERAPWEPSEPWEPY